MTLRLQVDSCRPAEVSALIQILLGGTPVRCRSRQLWIQAVQDYFEDVPLCVPCRKLLQIVWENAPQMGCKVYLVKPDGSHQAGDLEALCRGFVPFPGCGVHVHIRTPNAVVGSASCDDPLRLPLGCLVNSHMTCCLTEPPRATREIPWSTLIAQGWVVMIWGVSKTTISVFALTSIVSPFTALL